MKRYNSLIFFFTLFISQSTVLALTPIKDSLKKVAKIDTLLNQENRKGNFNGVILVSENGKPFFSNCYGFADKSNGKLLEMNSQFYLASVSKQFTSMAIMLLKQKGKLNYEDKLSDYFPEFSDYGENITIRHLLTHTSGIPDYLNELGASKKDITNEDVLRILTNNSKPNFKPGDKYSYSNSGYILLSLIIEKASGKEFHQYLKETIFIPLKMQNTLVYDTSKPIIDNKAIGYSSNGTVDDYQLLTTGDGGIYSTAKDLQLWLNAINSSTLISNETLQEAYKPFKLNNGKLSYYGFGWILDKKEQVIWHAGGLNGFRTMDYNNVADDITIVILTNGTNDSYLEITMRITTILKTRLLQLP